MSVFRPITFALVLLFFFASFALGIIVPPKPTAGPVVIERGMSASSIAKVLKEHNVIRSELMFVWAAYLSREHSRLGAGRFSFDNPGTVFDAIKKLTEEQKEIEIVIPEGFSTKDIAHTLEENNLVSGADFLAAAHGTEGYLFPDTYRFYELASAQEITDTLLKNFARKTDPLKTDIEKSGKSLDEIITMASILEKETVLPEDRAIVSGILWRRVREGVPLQVDAALWYITGKPTSSLTVADLKTKNPYNTYLYKGLPPGPISNPGLEAIEAAIHPKETRYYYYLSDENSTIHYAKTFEEHKKNRAKYL